MRDRLIMKRVATVALVVLCGTFLGCTEPAAETSISHVPKLGAPAADFANDDVQSPPLTHEVRKEVAETADDSPAAVEPPSIPQVFLTSEHSAMCRVRVGDQLPAISLPQLKGGAVELASLQGKKATVVAFWGDDPWMSATALADLKEIGPSADVAIVGIAVKLPNSEVQALLEKAGGAEFPQLIDSDGKAFNQVGMTKMPRIYVLNGSGEIVWFDIEYSQSTLRELKQTLAVLTAAR